MITVAQALKWLNKTENTHLEGEAQELADQIRNLQPKDPKLDDLVNAILDREYKDRLAYAEVCMICGGARYYWEQYQPALELIEAALKIYRSDRHRMAVALWLKGIVERELENPISAHQAWSESRQLFQHLFRDTTRMERMELADWYWKIIKLLEMDLIKTVGEMRDWFLIFDHHEHGDPIQPFNDLIHQILIDKKPYELKIVLENMRLISRKSGNLEEEALNSFAGAALLAELREFPDAETWVKQAVYLLSPETHHQAVARWLAGIILFAEKEKNDNEAVIQWRQAIDSFDQLALNADYRNEQSKRLWYEEKRDLMKSVLSEEIQARYQSI